MGVRNNGRMQRRKSVPSEYQHLSGKGYLWIVTFRHRLQKASEDEGEIVARIEAVPKGAGHKSGHACSEARFLPFRSHSQIYVVAQPVVCVDVPVLQVGPAVLSGLDSPWPDIDKSIPLDAARFGIDSLVAEAGQYTGAFGQSPHTVVLRPCHDPKHMEEQDSIKEARALVLVARQTIGTVHTRQLDECEYPQKPCNQFHGSRCATSRDSSLLACRRMLRRVGASGNVEQTCINPASILGIVEGRPSQECREEKLLTVQLRMRPGTERARSHHVACIVKKPGKLPYGSVSLELGETFLR